LEEILPLIRAATNEPVSWVGHAPDSVRAQLAERYGIRMVGFVDDIRPIVQDAACFVVPLRVGGGTRLKILDAWAMGKAVVSTAVGCEGLDAVDGENILVRDDPHEFASAVVDVLNDAQLRGRLEIAGRVTAETTYDWNRIYDKMIGAYLAILTPAHQNL
jgi:glycosyltransferase involved in cell wall biosynthesis